MERRTAEYCEFALKIWQNATPHDFLQLSLAVVVAGWFFGRLTGK